MLDLYVVKRSFPDSMSNLYMIFHQFLPRKSLRKHLGIMIVLYTLKR